MATITASQIILIMAVVLFLLGLATTVTGIVLLATRVIGRDVRTLAVQTTRLAQKGLADDIAGLVGNATNLMGAVNELIRTTAGVGVFMTVIGIVLMLAAGFMALKVI